MIMLLYTLHVSCVCVHFIHMYIHACRYQLSLALLGNNIGVGGSTAVSGNNINLQNCICAYIAALPPPPPMHAHMLDLWF